MGYRETYFRIRSDYEGCSGWKSKQDAAVFKAESRALFQSDGWQLQPGQEPVSDVVTKGRQDLYLHPMNFNGVILEEDIPHIMSLLEKAKHFRCYGVDCYEEYLDLDDEGYLALLEARCEEIISAILEECKTKRRNLYKVGPVALSVANRFSVHRLCDKEGRHNKANLYVGGVVDQLIADGRLITAKTKNGEGLRAATRKELMRRN